LQRYVNNALVFALSGLMHALVEYHLSADSSCGSWSMAVWFWLQIVAILAEELVQSAWAPIEARLSRSLSRRQLQWLSISKRVVGYLWVFSWMFLTVPKGYYTKTRCLQEKQGGSA